MKKFLTFFSFSILCFTISAQTSVMDKFSFEAPDATFASNEMGDGYRSETLKSSIQLNVFPISYDIIVKDVDKNVKDNMQIVSSEQKTLGGYEGYLQKVKLGGEDGFIGLSFFVASSEKETIVLHGSYPIAQDGDLFDKYLNAFESLAKK